MALKKDLLVLIQFSPDLRLVRFDKLNLQLQALKQIRKRQGKRGAFTSGVREQWAGIGFHGDLLSAAFHALRFLCESGRFQEGEGVEALVLAIAEAKAVVAEAVRQATPGLSYSYRDESADVTDKIRAVRASVSNLQFQGECDESTPTPDDDPETSMEDFQ